MDKTVSKRFTVTLPDAVFEDLEKWAGSEGRPTANLAAYLIEQAVRAWLPARYPDQRLQQSDPKQQGSDRP